MDIQFEKSLVKRLKTWCQPTLRPTSMIGIGDDAGAIYTSGRPVTICSDLMIEGTHFDTLFFDQQSGWNDVGHKGLARVLSDLAAMASLPLACTVSLALPKNWSETEIENNLEALFAGITKLASRHDCTVIGGDLSRTRGAFVADFAAIGEVRPASSLWRRDEVRPGDQIYVTGPLGGAAMALENLQAGKRAETPIENLKRHWRPEPRLDVASRLASAPVSGAIDISDGLVNDLTRVCQASHLSFELDEASVPLAEGASLQHALHGGDDYELLLFLPDSWHGCDFAQSELKAVGASRIGRVLSRT